MKKVNTIKTIKTLVALWFKSAHDIVGRHSDAKFSKLVQIFAVNLFNGFSNVILIKKKTHHNQVLHNNNQRGRQTT
jgi:hypothetical protein